MAEKPPYASVKAWVKALAYSPDDIVLGPHTTLDPEGYASLHALLDLADPSWRAAFTSALCPAGFTGCDCCEQRADKCRCTTCNMRQNASEDSDGR